MTLSPIGPSQSISKSFASPSSNSQRRISRALFDSATKEPAPRLFNATGRSSFQADLLVQSGKKLHSQKELEDALVHFTAAIAEKDKLKSNDLSHSEAYLGAGAIFDAQGKPESALHHYHEGSRKLNALQPASVLLAGSYVRIAHLYDAKGKYYYPQAAEFLKKALNIYKLGAELKPYSAQVHQKLGMINEKMGNPKLAKLHFEQGKEIGCFAPDPFFNGNGFLSEILGLITLPKNQIDDSPKTSRSSVATEPSPVKMGMFPPIDESCSPMQGFYLHQNVGPSPVKQKDEHLSPMHILTRNQLLGTSPKKVQDLATSTINPQRLDQNVGASPLQRRDAYLSPMHIVTRHQQQGTTPIQNQEIGVLALPEMKDAGTGAIRIERNELNPVINKLNLYKPGNSEEVKTKVAKALLDRLIQFSQGKIDEREVLAYVDAHFDIKNNPAFAGQRTRRLEAIFLEVRKALAQKGMTG
ncbi:MAG TPA: tetratricopeptide repeat protein [Chlamydiales bacterium]|nr:tetratricopeptide repeat protein [Chlamydiales bacterium]